MRVVLLGAPGSGKGTQGERITKKYGIPQFSSGDILRKAIREGTELGVKAKGCINKGNLVPDSVIVDVMAVRLAEADCRNGFILDGFPRTIGQAKGLDDILNKIKSRLDAVICINVSEESVVERLGGRRQCPKCSAIYHVEYQPPAKSGICDKCGFDLYQRDDDKEETIKNRLKIYRSETAPLLDYYKDILHNIDGARDPSEVFKDVSSLIDSFAKRL